MPKFWDFLGRDPPRHRNLQEGLFQIASQTCSLLVQVNNTNNISYGHNATNILCNTLQTAAAGFPGSGRHGDDREQLVVLLPPANKGPRFKHGGGLMRPRLSVRIIS